MFSPVKAITAGAVVFAIGGVLLIAQPFEQEGNAPAAERSAEAMAPMAFTGRIHDDEVLDGTESESEAGFIHLRDEVLFKRFFEVSDPRMAGDVVITRNTVELNPPAARAGGLMSDVYEITNDGGRWVGTATGFDYEDIPSSVHTILLDGTDGYEGLTAYVIAYYNDGRIEGAIIPGGMPPRPEPYEAE